MFCTRRASLSDALIRSQVISLIGFDHPLNALENPDSQYVRDVRALMATLLAGVWRFSFGKEKELDDAYKRFVAIVESVCLLLYLSLARS